MDSIKKKIVSRGIAARQEPTMRQEVGVSKHWLYGEKKKQGEVRNQYK